MTVAALEVYRFLSDRKAQDADKPCQLRQVSTPRRYFLHSWPRLCWLAFDGSRCFGVVVCKQDDHKGMLRGYIAMLVVKPAYRGLGVGERVLPASQYMT